LVRVEVLAVGKELLIGRTLNTNAHWIGKRLALMGTMINEVTTVDDDLDEISQALASSLSRRPGFLVAIGGLGPTPDDMTLKGVAMGAGKRLSLNRDALSLIKEHYAKRGMADVELTPARRKMTMLPSGARPILNPVGTAPGVRLVVGGTVVFCLPGVPSEMRSIFRRSVEPEIRARVGELSRGAVTLRFEGIYESAMAPLIRNELRKNPGAYIKSHPRGLKEGVSRIELDIVVVRRRRSDAERTSAAIAREMIREVTKAGGVTKSARGLT
jgi:nicotinamide-nucleotide amidase